MEIENEARKQQLAERRALLVMLEKDRERFTALLAKLGEKVLEAIAASNEKLEEKIKEERTFATRQQTKLEEQVASVRREIAELQGQGATGKW